MDASLPRIGGRDALLVLLVAAASFAANQLPYVLSSRPDSIGDKGDSSFHVAIQMKLRTPALFPKDVELSEWNLASRPALEFAIPRAVGWVADHLAGGRLLAANIAVFWLYHLVFLAGCYLLGAWFLGGRWGGALFALAATGASTAIRYGWGMIYAAVVPHDVALASCPWFILAFLAWNESAPRMVLLLGLLGLAVNVYPLQPLYLALAFLGVLALERRVGLAFVAGLAFLAGAAPSVLLSAVPALTARRAALTDGERAVVEKLLERYYGDLIPITRHALARMAAVDGKTPLWAFLALGAFGVVAKRQTRGWRVEDRLLASFTAMIGVLTIIGLFGGAALRPLLVFLFVRSSSFLYVGAYLYLLWLVGWLWRERDPLARAGCAVLLVGTMACVWWHSAAANLWIRRAPPQSSASDFLELCRWARVHTPPDALFLVPPYSKQGTWYALRVYGERGITLQGQMGEIAISAPKAAVEFERAFEEIQPLYARRSTTLDFLRVARDRRADYIVTDRYTPALPDLPLAWWNDTYRVYAVPPR